MTTAKKRITVKTLDITWAKLSQGILYTELVNVGGEKLKFYIERDSYNSQSKARVSIWDKNERKWNQIHWIPSSQQQIVKSDVSCYQKPEAMRMSDKAAFQTDRNALLAYAKKVLF